MTKTNNKIMGKKLFFICLLAFVLSFNFVSSQPTTNVFLGDRGIQMEYSQKSIFEIDNGYTFRVVPYNSSNGLELDNTTTDCLFYMLDANGVVIFEEPMHYNSFCFYENISAGNFSKLGPFTYCIKCNASNIGGFVSVRAEISNNELPKTTHRSIIGVGFTLLLAMLAFGFLYSGKEFNQAGMKIAFLILSFVFFMGSIITSFVLAYESDMYLNYTNTVQTFLFAFGIILILVFAYILINQIKSSLDLIAQKKGYEMDF